MSRYKGVPTENWPSITRQLIDEHPFSREDILGLVGRAWSDLWATRIGCGAAALSLSEMSLPAQITGHFFEKLLARHAALAFPGEWRGGVGGYEKDLHFIPDFKFSIEVKTSGQMGDKIYGNRSYGQAVSDPKKDKSGYFITVNFYGDKITLVRFGWIDSWDWRPQGAASGQAASLASDVYQGKLEILHGEYVLDAPVDLLPGVGPGLAHLMREANIQTYRDLVYNGHLDAKFFKARESAFAICEMFL